MSEVAERLAADGVIIEDCDIPSGPFSVLCMKHPHVPLPVSRQLRNDYLRSLKTYSTSQQWYPRFSGQSCKLIMHFVKEMFMPEIQCPYQVFTEVRVQHLDRFATFSAFQIFNKFRNFLSRI